LKRSQYYYFFIILLLSDTPNVLLPDSSVCKATQAKWLLEICEEHVKKFIFNADELNALVDQTKELQEAHKQEGKWRCRAEGCMATYVYHSSRVRHEVEVHRLSFDNGTEERDPFGYFYCRTRCGEVFKTKTIRNRCVCVCVLQLPSILECLYLTHEIDTKLLHTVTH